MLSQPYVVEMAVLLLFAFVLGGLVGFWARRWFMPSRVSEASETTADQANAPPPDQHVLPAEESASGIAAQMHESPAAEPDAVAIADASAAKPAAAKPAKTTRKPKRALAPEGQASDASGEAGEGKPALLAAARDGAPDDLKKIKGIGPKIEKLLNGLGIYHYDQIAAWGATETAWVDDKLSFRGRIDREGWVSQAKALVQSGS